MVLLGSKEIPGPDNKIWPREAKSVYPTLSQPGVICTGYGEAAVGLATEMSYHFKYKPWESQEVPGRLLIAKWLGKSSRKLNKGTWDQVVQTVGLLLIQNPNCSPTVLEHLKTFPPWNEGIGCMVLRTMTFAFCFPQDLNLAWRLLVRS